MMINRLTVLLFVFVASAGVGLSQVHYHPDGNPWKQKAGSGPDSVVPGWYYNLGITGIRVELIEEVPEILLVRYVFAQSPADGKIQIDDAIVGVNGKRFKVPHKNGYGMDKFGPDGPIADFAKALDESQSQGKGVLRVMVLRETSELEFDVRVGMEYGSFGKKFPFECPKSDLILSELLDYLVAVQGSDGSWGQAPHDTFAPLALMSSKKKAHRKSLLASVKMHAETTSSEDDSWLINWRYMAAGIVLSEYYLSTREKWLLEELQEIYDFLISSQYVDPYQINPKSHETHPHAVPKHALDSHGGWGHNPGFEGYGPIAMLTAQGALVFSLMKECGIEVDKERHEFAYDFLERASGKNFYVWYGDESAGDDDWADMGRTGTSAIAHKVSPWPSKHLKRALGHAKIIGEHPGSFPDTHGSPIMGMSFGALGAYCDRKSFANLMNANKWWFTLAHCQDGSFYYQPNRDNAGYGADSRISSTAATAFILSLPRRHLYLTKK